MGGPGPELDLGDHVTASDLVAPRLLNRLPLTYFWPMPSRCGAQCDISYGGASAADAAYEIEMENLVNECCRENGAASPQRWSSLRASQCMVEPRSLGAMSTLPCTCAYWPDSTCESW
jgi:hypothetical protein